MQKKSIYTYAAEAGLPTGIYLTLMSACVLLSLQIPITPMLFVPLALGFPFFIWFLLKNIAKAEPTYLKFSSLWLGGIYTVIFGTLICMLFSSLYVVFIEPGFVQKYVANALSAIETSPYASEYETTMILMRKALDAHILPTGMEFLMTMAWFICFAGSLLSLFIALIITKNGKKVSEEISA